MVFTEVLREIIGVHNNVSEDEECDYCDGSGIIYIDDGEWEECDFCCDSDSDSDSDYEPNSSDEDTSDSGYDTDSSNDSEDSILIC